MNNTFRLSAIALMVLAAQPVMADTATTKGGFQIKSDDGTWEAKLGGRIHLDANLFVNEDDLQPNRGSTPEDLLLQAQQRAVGINGDYKENSTAFFRRARITIEGKAYDWNFKFENDFAGQGSAAGSGFREAWIGRKVAKDINMRLGQAKPYRGMEELTSSNEILMMERPNATATGIYTGRQFQIGAFFDGSGDIPNSTVGYGYGVSLYNTRSFNDSATEGLGINGRFFAVPLRAEGQILHLGISGSLDRNPTLSTEALPVSHPIAARLTGSQRGLRPTLSYPWENAATLGLEAAYRMGQFYVQGEYAKAMLDTYRYTAASGATGASTVTGDEEVSTGYIQASYILNPGVSKPYDAKRGVFRSPKFEGEGIWELKARYDMIQNDGIDGIEINNNSPMPTQAQLDALQLEREGSALTLGANYYYNSNVRMMLEYVRGTSKVNKPVTVGTGANQRRADSSELSADLIQARLQYSF